MRSGLERMKRTALRADGLLLITAAIWGSGFVPQRAAMEHMGPWTFTSLRYAIGAAALVPFVVLLRRRTGVSSAAPPRQRRFTRRTIAGGVVLGLIMLLAAGLQQVGLVTTTAARAGFITGLYVTIVPVLGMLAGNAIRPGHVAGAVLAAVGLFLLSDGVAGAGLTAGDLWVAACAVMWAAHVLAVSLIAPRADALGLALVQFVTVAVVGGLVTAAVESPEAAGVIAGGGWLLYSGVFAIGVAFTIQIVAQRDAPPTHAAVLMSLEAVFGALFGYLILHETLNDRELAGCGLMLSGAIASQVIPAIRGKRKTPVERQVPRDAVR